MKTKSQGEGEQLSYQATLPQMPDTAGEESPMRNAFPSERRKYDQMLPYWREKCPGQYIVIHGNRTAGPYKTLGEAVFEGRRELGDEDLFIHQIGAPFPLVTLS